MKRVMFTLLLLGFCGIALANSTLDEITMLEQNKSSAASTRITPTASSLTSNASSFVAEHVLVIFFSSTCHFCQRFVPVVKQWAESEHWQVIPITTNGASLPDFPHPLMLDPDIKAHYFNAKPVVVPASFVLNTTTHQAYAVSVGALTLSELNERMNSLLPKIETYEKGAHA